jgi:hypothetical protein
LQTSERKESKVVDEKPDMKGVVAALVAPPMNQYDTAAYKHHPQEVVV